MESGSCFVAVPSNRTFLREVIRDTLKASGVQVLGEDDLSGAFLLVRGLIQRADLMVADVTEPNPNVFYELGVAAGLRKPALLIVEKPSRPLFDLVGYESVAYGPEEYEKLSGFIQYWVRDNLRPGTYRTTMFDRPANVA